MATTIINRCSSSPVGGIVTSCPYSAFFVDTTATTHHSPMMHSPDNADNNRFCVESAKPTALMPMEMLFLTSSGRYHR